MKRIHQLLPLWRWLGSLICNGLLFVGAPVVQAAPTALNDAPLFSNNLVPSNVLLTLSVEYPTALSRAHNTSQYQWNNIYIGYFDPEKCYKFVDPDPSNKDPKKLDTPANRPYFEPVEVGKPGKSTTSTSTSPPKTTCTGLWSGNFMNWATTPTIDPFRWALTGGYRDIDTKTQTILQKGYMSEQIGFLPDSEATRLFSNSMIDDSDIIQGATPFNWSHLYIRVYKFGTAMRVTDNFSSLTDTRSYDVFGVSSSTTASGTYDMPVRVEVCKSPLLEDNCTKYGSNIYKPTGLIQDNAAKLRFGVVSYLNDSNIQRDGGVLRARLKSVGPETPVPGKASTKNKQTEWDPDTGIFTSNPDDKDVKDTPIKDISSSGVINYVNQFGLFGKGYKAFDPVSEMYYVAIRYLRNLGSVPEYSNNLNATMADGFPVITNWDDPIQYACQKNAILGIGDENTHPDANLPGSTVRGGNEPPMPSTVQSDLPTAQQDIWPFNVQTVTEKVIALEGLPTPPGVQRCATCPNTNFIAGLAYAAHTADLRPNDFGKEKGNFKTTVNTYWLNVEEGGGEGAKNQYWLATKYGGFDVPDGYSTYGNTAALPQGAWNKAGDKTRIAGQLRPDNYFEAGNPNLLVSGLKTAFKNISATIQYSSALAIASPVRVTSGDISYSTQYFAANWSGDVIASQLAFNSAGEPVATTNWSARSLLETQAATDTSLVNGWDTKRFIATYDNGNGVPFRVAATGITDATKLTALTDTGKTPTDVINFLRGDRSNEGKLFRRRDFLLGDIVSSKAYPVGAPSATYRDAGNPGYGAFVALHQSRSPVVYVGANDGMLHAFNGTLSTNGGKELFAYVPSLLFQGPNGTPKVDGLISLTDINYVHHFFVDATPVVTDVDFGRAGTLGNATTPSDWHSLLVGGLGKGGKGFYALDVTDPATITDETKLAAKVLWEVNPATMGFSYGQAVTVKTAKYGWVVILTSGYNNSDGKGYFYIVNPKNGTVLETVSTNIGDTGNPSGLTQAAAYVSDYSDYTADAVYAGDLLGNVWRLDLTATAATPPAVSSPYTVTKIAQLTGPTGAAQPVTTRPLIEIDKNSLKRYVLIGTGQLLADKDITNGEVQSFYAINDGTGNSGGFDTAAKLPAGVTYPITRANLNENKDVLSGITASPKTPSGWYVDLPVSSNNIAQRVTSQPTANGGILAFAANLPDSEGNVCVPSGSNNVYELDYSTGKTQLSDSSGPTAFVNSKGLNTGLYFANIDGKVKLVTTTTTGGSNVLNGRPSTNPFHRLNWRQVPVVN